MKTINLIVALTFVVSGCANNTLEPTYSTITDCSGNVIENISSRKLTLCKAVPPAYPESAFRKKIQGTCITTFDVNISGQIVNPVVSCIPTGYFEKAALATKKHFRFLPAVVNGKMVASKGITRTDTFSF